MVEKRSGKATITEVAKLAGVSTATAGRVLGGYGYSSEAIRRKVRDSAEQLGYRPNLLARGLITGKTRTIGVVAGDIQSPFYSSVLRGIADVARASGFGVLVTNSDETLDLERDAVQLLMEKQVDGLIVSPCDTGRAKHLRRALEDKCPIVQIDRVVNGLAADSVTVSNRAASRECVEQLISAGHRRIGMVAELIRWESDDVAAFVERVGVGAMDPRFLYPSWQRLFGYVEAHLAAGIVVDLSLIGRVGVYSRVAAKNQVINLLSRPDRPTAVFTGDGLMSVGAMEAITVCGMKMPEDLSFIGFDDLDWMSFTKPGVTAIVQPLMAMGEIAARLMLDRIASPDGVIQHVTLETSLARRGSVGKPRVTA